MSRILGWRLWGHCGSPKNPGTCFGEITQPINRVSYPGYAKVNNDPAKVMEVFQDVMGIMMVAGFMVAIGIFHSAFDGPTLLVANGWTSFRWSRALLR